MSSNYNCLFNKMLFIAFNMKYCSLIAEASFLGAVKHQILWYMCVHTYLSS